MNGLLGWCKRCFGMKTIKDKVKEELSDLEKELFILNKNIQWNVKQINWASERQEYLKTAYPEIAHEMKELTDLAD